MYITRTDIPKKSTVRMYNVDNIPAKTIHSIRVYKRSRNSRQIDLRKQAVKNEIKQLQSRIVKPEKTRVVL